VEPSYDWHEHYLAAIFETDPSKLKARIDAAQAAIDYYLQEVNAGVAFKREERHAIETALAGLEVLRKYEV
jgi:hypothetical protein